MRLFEFADPNSKKLLALSQFLVGRSDDEAAKKEISQAAFIDAAKSLGINVTPDNLVELVGQPPLTNILEPIEPNSGVIRFKGNEETTEPGGMSVDQARATVNSNAKSALKRRQ
jgi:hypothetical protein